LVHTEGINTLDSDKYRMICTLAYYIPKWQIAKEILQALLEKKRWRAIDIMYGDIIKNPNYVYPAVYIEEPMGSQIMNIKKTKFANESYSR